MNLNGKVALVTGAGSGIGKASAVAFAKAGAKVGVLSDTRKQIDETADEIRTHGGDAIAVTADVSDSGQVEAAVRQLVDKYGRLDVVFANAGINSMAAPIDDLTPEEWRRTLDVNLTGTYLTIHHTVPLLKKAGGGSIVVTSSINGTRYFSNSGATAYAVSKAGQLAMVKMLAVELGQFGIRVNAICPGAIDTEISDNSEKRHVDQVKIKIEKSREIPLTGSKKGTSQQVADLALFLASDASSHVSGTPVFIDGAQSLL